MESTFQVWKPFQLVPQNVSAHKSQRIPFYQDFINFVEIICWLPPRLQLPWFAKTLDIIQNGLKGLQKSVLTICPDLKNDDLSFPVLSGSFGHLQLILSTCSFIQSMDVKKVEQVLVVDVPLYVEVKVRRGKGPWSAVDQSSNYAKLVEDPNTKT